MKVPSRESVRNWAIATCIVSILGVGVWTAVRNTQRLQQVTREIQNQRRQSVLDSCRSDNAKYAATIAQLRKYGPLKPGVALLIGDLVPYTANCEKLVQAKVPTHGT